MFKKLALTIAVIAVYGTANAQVIQPAVVTDISIQMTQSHKCAMIRSVDGQIADARDNGVPVAVEFAAVLNENPNQSHEVMGWVLDDIEFVYDNPDMNMQFVAHNLSFLNCK
jgi:hypothetical protein